MVPRAVERDDQESVLSRMPAAGCGLDTAMVVSSVRRLLGTVWTLGPPVIGWLARPDYPAGLIVAPGRRIAPPSLTGREI